MHPIESFLSDLDTRWAVAGDTRIVLQVIGSAALFLQTDYDRGTKDSDILETEQIRGLVGERLLALAGKDSELYVRHRIYLEVVGRGLPFLPHGPAWHARDLGLTHFASSSSMSMTWWCRSSSASTGAIAPISAP